MPLAKAIEKPEVMATQLGPLDWVCAKMGLASNIMAPINSKNFTFIG
jgi:hypothetical protein